MMPPEQRPDMLKWNEYADHNISSTLSSFSKCGSCDGHVTFLFGDRYAFQNIPEDLAYQEASPKSQLQTPKAAGGKLEE